MVDQPVIAKIIAWLASLLPAILGSAVSLRLVQDGASYKSRVSSFFAGIVLAHYIGWFIIERFHIVPESMASSSILFVVGLFGVTTAAEINKQIPEFLKGLFEKLISFIGKK